jgi:hypothetical protein
MMTRSIRPFRIVCACKCGAEFVSYQFKLQATRYAKHTLGWRRVLGEWYAEGHFPPKPRPAKKARQGCDRCGKQLTVSRDGKHLHSHRCGARGVYRPSAKATS